MLVDKAFNILINSKNGKCQRGLISRVYNSFDKVTLITNKRTGISSEKGEIHSPFIDNIRSADLADMQLLCKFNKVLCILLWVDDIFSKYACVSLLIDKKVLQLLALFRKF